MDDLSMVYKGEVIYVPEKLKVFLEPWLHQNAPRKMGKFLQQSGGFQKGSVSFDDGYHWNSKKVIFFCEDELVVAYKKMPVPHIPERVTDAEFTIEFTLEETTAAKRASSKPWQDTGVKAVKRENKQKGGKLW
jgi:hypothetical protein